MGIDGEFGFDLDQGQLSPCSRDFPALEREFRPLYENYCWVHTTLPDDVNMYQLEYDFPRALAPRALRLPCYPKFCYRAGRQPFCYH